MEFCYDLARSQNLGRTEGVHEIAPARITSVARSILEEAGLVLRDYLIGKA